MKVRVPAAFLGKFTVKVSVRGRMRFYIHKDGDTPLFGGFPSKEHPHTTKLPVTEQL